MQRNYFLFKTQINWLNTHIQNHVIQECFSYKKSELIIKIFNEHETFVRISVLPSLPYIILTRKHKIKESKITLFNELQNQKILNISIDVADKLIILKTDNYRLESIFFGKTPNIILNDQNGIELKRFKKQFNNHLKNQVNKTYTVNEISENDLRNKILKTPNENIVNFLAKTLTGFNYSLAKECCYRSSINFNILVLEISDKQIQQLYKSIKIIGKEINNPIPMIYYKKKLPKSLTTIKMQHLEQDYDPKIFDTINEAWDTFIWQNQQFRQIDKIKVKCLKILNSRIKFLKKTINKIEKFEKLEERKKMADLKGNLILTNLNKIPKGVSKIKLKNIFSENQELLDIKLNPAKSAKDNAQIYFNKFNDIEVQKNRTKNRKTAISQELKILNELIEKFSDINTEKQVLKLQNILIEKNLIQHSDTETSGQILSENKFKKIILENKWNVFIGKNSKNNDLLTFGFANKFDWWFHAQSVPGSHTIIHLENKNDNPPFDIIEKTASLAAFNSSDKHSKNVPVIYTQVRYVKRIRKANPGTVSVLQHKTIFVEPKNL